MSHFFGLSAGPGPGIVRAAAGSQGREAPAKRFQDTEFSDRHVASGRCRRPAGRLGSLALDLH